MNSTRHKAILFLLYCLILFNCTSTSPTSPANQEKTHTIIYSITGSVTNLTIGYIDANGFQQVAGQNAPWVVSFSKITPFAIGLYVNDMNIITLNSMTATIKIDGTIYKQASGTGSIDLGTATIDKSY
jgi:hypothetical protein